MSVVVQWLLRCARCGCEYVWRRGDPRHKCHTESTNAGFANSVIK